jgi:glucose-6-phosphate isomerase
MSNITASLKCSTATMPLFKHKLTEMGIKMSNAVYGLVDRVSKEKILDRINNLKISKSDLILDLQIRKSLEQAGVLAQLLQAADSNDNNNYNFILLMKGQVYEILPLETFVRDYPARIEEFRL